MPQGYLSGFDSKPLSDQRRVRMANLVGKPVGDLATIPVRLDDRIGNGSSIGRDGILVAGTAFALRFGPFGFPLRPLLQLGAIVS